MSPDIPNINTQPLLAKQRAVKPVKPRRMYAHHAHPWTSVLLIKKTKTWTRPVLVFDLATESITALIPAVKRGHRKINHFSPTDGEAIEILIALGFLKRGQRKQPKRRGGAR